MFIDERLEAFCRLNNLSFLLPSSNHHIGVSYSRYADDHAIGAVLEQQKNNKPQVIHSASKTLHDTS